MKNINQLHQEIFENFVKTDWGTYRSFLLFGYKPSELKMEVDSIRLWIKRLRELRSTK